MTLDSEFDAYHKWLGIPPHKQPPTHYALLGLELFESDPDVIEAAAARQIAHIQTYKLGPQSDRSQQMLNEMSRAKLCLLNASHKADYDRGLRQSTNDRTAAMTQAHPPVAPPNSSTDGEHLWDRAVTVPGNAPLVLKARHVVRPATVLAKSRRQSFPPQVLAPIVIALSSVILVAVVIIFWPAIGGSLSDSRNLGPETSHVPPPVVQKSGLRRSSDSSPRASDRQLADRSQSVRPRRSEGKRRGNSEKGKEDTPLVAAPTKSSIVQHDRREDDTRLPAKKGDAGIDGMQGIWQTDRSYGRGEDVTAAVSQANAVLQVNDSRFTLGMNGRLYTGELLVDSSTMPQQMTFKVSKVTSPKGNMMSTMEFRGIYNLEGDQLTCCWVIWVPDGDNVPRPTTFATDTTEALKAMATNTAQLNAPRPGQVRYVFQRAQIPRIGPPVAPQVTSTTDSSIKSKRLLSDARDWLSIFRSADPSIWNRSINEGSDRRALPVSEVPGDISFLRLGMSQTQFVIIPITKVRLIALNEDSHFNWNGSNTFEYNARTLGIFDKAMDHRVTGDIHIRAGEPSGRGWGFGVRSFLDDHQGYSWGGEPIGPTVFEIAVKSSDLTDQEKTHLLTPATGKVIDTKPIQ